MKKLSILLAIFTVSLSLTSAFAGSMRQILDWHSGVTSTYEFKFDKPVYCKLTLVKSTGKPSEPYSDSLISEYSAHTIQVSYSFMPKRVHTNEGDFSQLTSHYSYEISDLAIAVQKKLGINGTGMGSGSTDSWGHSNAGIYTTVASGPAIDPASKTPPLNADILLYAGYGSKRHSSTRLTPPLTPKKFLNYPEYKLLFVRFSEKPFKQKTETR